MVFSHYSIAEAEVPDTIKKNKKKNRVTNPISCSTYCKNQLKQLKAPEFTLTYFSLGCRTGFWAAVPWQSSWKAAVKFAQTKGLRKFLENRCNAKFSTWPVISPPPLSPSP